MIWFAHTILTIRSWRFSEECDRNITVQWPSKWSDWPIRFWPSDLVWRGVRLVSSWWTWLDWLLCLTCFLCLLLASQPRDVRHAKRWRRKWLRKGVFFAVTNTRKYAVLTCLWRLNRYNKVTLIITYSTRGGVLKLCTMLFCQELDKCSCDVV